MESLFRQTDFETRISFNMNVLDQGRVPRVMNLREVLQAYLDHRHDVLVRRKNFRSARSSIGSRYSTVISSRISISMK